MNIKTILSLMLILTLITGCTSNSDGGNGEPLMCTEDAKICPDGTAVGRDPNNNCEFFECSSETPIPVEPDGGIGLTNPYVKYVSESTEECKLVLFQCIEGAEAFFDDTGCGCRAIEPKTYVSQDLEECTRLDFMCENNRVQFTDETGCGCEFTFEQQSPSTDGKLKAFTCEQDQREVSGCTKEYVPVCGWSDPEKIQCITYPCAQTYGNSCEACKDENVAYYTLGLCPSADGNDCTCPEGYRKDGESCNPECYYDEPQCLTPSISCETALK